MTRLAAILIALCLAAPAYSQDRSVEFLLDSCTKRTTVYALDVDGNAFKGGTKLGEQCVSYLEGVLYALQNENLACPKMQEKRFGIEYLVSVIENYANEFPQPKTDAALVVSAAFKRVFHCREK